MFRIFLPHVFPQFDETFIKNIFENKHHIGKISRIDIVSKFKTHNSVYVHFDFVNHQFAHVRRFVQDIASGNKVTLNYQGKHYWNILQDYSKGKNFSLNERKLSIDIDTNLDVSSSSMKDNKFFSDLVKKRNKRIDLVKNNDKFVIDIPLFSKQDYLNMDEIDAAMEEQYYMDLFMDEIDQFDQNYFALH